MATSTKHMSTSMEVVHTCITLFLFLGKTHTTKLPSQGQCLQRWLLVVSWGSQGKTWKHHFLLNNVCSRTHTHIILSWEPTCSSTTPVLICATCFWQDLHVQPSVVCIPDNAHDWYLHKGFWQQHRKKNTEHKPEQHFLSISANLCNDNCTNQGEIFARNRPTFYCFHG